MATAALCMSTHFQAHSNRWACVWCIHSSYEETFACWTIGKYAIPKILCRHNVQCVRSYTQTQACTNNQMSNHARCDVFFVVATRALTDALSLNITSKYRLVLKLRIASSDVSQWRFILFPLKCSRMFTIILVHNSCLRRSHSSNGRLFGNYLRFRQ